MNRPAKETKVGVYKKFRLVITQPALVHNTTYIDTRCVTSIEALDLLEEIQNSISHPNGRFHAEIYEHGHCIHESDYGVEL